MLPPPRVALNFSLEADEEHLLFRTLAKFMCRICTTNLYEVKGIIIKYKYKAMEHVLIVLNEIHWKRSDPSRPINLFAGASCGQLLGCKNLKSRVSLVFQPKMINQSENS